MRIIIILLTTLFLTGCFEHYRVSYSNHDYYRNYQQNSGSYCRYSYAGCTTYYTNSSRYHGHYHGGYYHTHYHRGHHTHRTQAHNHGRTHDHDRHKPNRPRKPQHKEPYRKPQHKPVCNTKPCERIH